MKIVRPPSAIRLTNPHSTNHGVSNTFVTFLRHNILISLCRLRYSFHAVVRVLLNSLLLYSIPDARVVVALQMWFLIFVGLLSLRVLSLRPRSGFSNTLLVRNDAGMRFHSLGRSLTLSARSRYRSLTLYSIPNALLQVFSYSYLSLMHFFSVCFALYRFAGKLHRQKRYFTYVKKCDKINHKLIDNQVNHRFLPT